VECGGRGTIASGRVGSTRRQVVVRQCGNGGGGKVVCEKKGGAMWPFLARVALGL
jgi:hypothetical protein